MTVRDAPESAVCGNPGIEVLTAKPFWLTVCDYLNSGQQLSNAIEKFSLAHPCFADASDAACGPHLVLYLAEQGENRFPKIAGGIELGKPSALGLFAAVEFLQVHLKLASDIFLISCQSVEPLRGRIVPCFLLQLGEAGINLRSEFVFRAGQSLANPFSSVEPANTGNIDRNPLLAGRVVILDFAGMSVRLAFMLGSIECELLDRMHAE